MIRNTVHLCIAIAVTTCVISYAFGQGQSVVNSSHNLSTLGSSIIRAATEEQVCIFCHTPHNASPINPLWNRSMSIDSYIVYSSNSLDAQPGQPTGSSKMCLSCHDGTIAIGSIASRNQIIQMAQGITTIPPGSFNLGTDLSDDHPISFRYDSSLVFKDQKLVDPHQLPPQVKLDHNRELQCTSCHDPHDNSRGSFLVMSNQNSALCRSCHQIGNTTVLGHSDCSSCHMAHTAPSGPYLLTGDRITQTCINCHDGNHGLAANILADLNKISVHDTNSPVDPDEPIPGHATCADCHEQHTLMRGSAAAPNIHPSLGEIDGVSASGSPINIATTEYEVCFKCHADKNSSTASWVSRQITQINTRLEFDLQAVSYHPINGPGRNMDVPSLKPPWTTSSVMHCSDCHGSDTSKKAGGTGPNGVHGSNEPPLLVARYETADFTTESASSYALCYKCHYRDTNNGVLLDRSFPHSVHVRDNATSCATCHDAHGISSAQGSRRNNSNLINFDTSIVFPERGTGKLVFIDTGIYSGSCTLTCHGVDHSPRTY